MPPPGDTERGHLKVAKLTAETSVFKYDIDSAFLEIVDGVSPGRRVPLLKKKLTIGRDPEADIPLEDPDVSSWHAEVVRDSGTFILRDTGSRNGVEYSGSLIDETPLVDGDEFRICRNRFRFVWPQGGEEDGDILGKREVTEVDLQFQSPWRRWLRLGAVLLGLFVVLGCMSYFATRSSLPKVVIAKVERRPLRQTTSFSGRLVPRSEVRVFASVSARVVKVLAKEGQAVKKGDPIVELDPEMLAMAFQKAKAELAASHAAVRAADAGMRTSDRKVREDRALARKGILSRAEVDASASAQNARRSDYTNALAQLRMAETRLAQAKRDHKDTVVRSPIKGRVTTINIKVGESPHNLRGIPVATVEDSSELLAEISAGEAKIGLLRTGQRAQIRVSGAGLGTEFPGKVVQIAPKAQSPTNQAGATRYTAKVNFDKRDKRLRVGMQVQVRIITAEKKSALTVPLAAVATGGRSSGEVAEQVAVYDPATETIRWVGIETDLIATQDVEILSGPKEGDWVVSGPADLLLTLEQGARVEVVQEGE